MTRTDTIACSTPAPNATLRLVAETVADVAKRLRVQHQARTAGLFGNA